MPAEQSAGVVQSAVAGAAESRCDRAFTKYTLLAGYSYLDLWVPSKIGLAVVWNDGPSHSYELGYVRGIVGYDLFNASIGHVSDERWTLLWRRFGGYNSFHLLLGVHLHSVSIRISENLMRTVATTDERLKIVTAGPTFGVGSRWQTSGGFVWSFDWFVIHVPLWTLHSHTPFIDAAFSGTAREDVLNVVRLLRDLPSATLIGAQLGYAF